MLVGNEPVIGMWNPSKAIPMNWSQGNIWTVELVSTLHSFNLGCAIYNTFELDMHWDVFTSQSEFYKKENIICQSSCILCEQINSLTYLYANSELDFKLF